MRRDIGMCREVITMLESGPVTAHSVASRFQVDRAHACYQLWLLRDAGIAKVEFFNENGFADDDAAELAMFDDECEAVATALTWCGCEVLDAVRDEGRWREYVRACRSECLEPSFEVACRFALNRALFGAAK